MTGPRKTTPTRPRALALLLGLLLLGTAPGCFEYDEKIRIGEDGAGTIDVRYSILPALLEGTADSGFSLPLDEAGVREMFADSPLRLRTVEILPRGANREVRFELEFDRMEDLTLLSTFPGHRIIVEDRNGLMHVVRTVDPVPELKEKLQPKEGRSGLLNLLGQLGGSLSRLRFEVEIFFPVQETDGVLTTSEKKGKPHLMAWEFAATALATEGIRMTATIEKPSWLLAVMKASWTGIEDGGWRYLSPLVLLGAAGLWYRRMSRRVRTH